MASEGEALVQAFKSGQVFYTAGRMEGGTGDKRKRTEDCETGFVPKLKSGRTRVGTSFQKRPTGSSSLRSFEDPTHFM